MTWKLAWLLRTYRTCNLTVGFSKYEFYNKLLGGVTLVRVISGITWTQPIYIYIYKLGGKIGIVFARTEWGKKLALKWEWSGGRE